jgi:alkylated DNA repair dioxygenase AlkB
MAAPRPLTTPLLSFPASLPQGFRLETEFINTDEERELLGFLQTLPLGSIRMHGVTAKRQVAQFGWHYAFESFQLSPAKSMPEEFRDLRSRAAAIAGVKPDELSEILVTFYPVGAAIGWHRDAPPFGIVAGVSVGAACRMRFRTIKEENRITTAVELPARSIYVLNGPARQLWQHTIPSVKSERWSITFRTLRRARTAGYGRG